MKRMTRQRAAILSLLKSVDTHPTAQWMYDQLRSAMPHISLGTVYRNLSELVDEGQILRLSTGDDTAHYDATTVPHHHFCCTACARVFDAPVEDTGVMDNRMLYGAMFALGFRPQRHTLYIYGLCRECAEQSDRPNP